MSRIVPTMRTWQLNDIGTSTLLNSNVRDGVNFALAPPLAQISQNTVQSIPNNVLTAINFDTSEIDTDNGHSTVTNNTEYIVQVAGIYRVNGLAAIAANATGVRGAEIGYNGAQTPYTFVVIPSAGASFSTNVSTGTLLIQAAVGDNFTLLAYQTSGVALNTVSGQSSLNVEFVHS